MKNVRQRKLLLALPLLAIPFLTIAFWVLGGGKVKKETDSASRGLNLAVPDAWLKEDKLLDKLSFYEQADKDSQKMAEWMRSDPYYKRDTSPLFPNELEELTTLTAGKYNQRLNGSLYEGNVIKPEDQLLQKLQMLDAEMKRNNAGNNEEIKNQPLPGKEISAELDRLEQLLKVNNAPVAEDAEMKQLEGTLDKILDIQHPQRVRERSDRNRDIVLAVRRTSGTDTIVKGFYSFSEEKEFASPSQNTIEAIIASNQTIVNGSVVKFRLLHEIYINGKLIPKDILVSGIASLEGERLQLEINSIRCGKSIYPVKLEVFDMDGLPGIYIPGTISRDVAKESLNNSLSLADITSVDPSFKAQATTTGISALKSLVSKKVKLVRVQLKAGYKVLLNPKNQ